MKIAYTDTPRWRDDTWEVVRAAGRIIANYQAKGFDLTLRQLFYQFVATQPLSVPFENSERSYKRVGRIVSDARMAGELPWTAIVDRTRSLRGVTHWTDPEEIVEGAASGFRLEKWKRQPHRVEVWIEKDALVGVISGICRELDVDYFSCRGYASQSAMWRAARRFRRYEKAGLQDVTILHLGDHDPSGIDMSRDIQDRLYTFGSGARVERIALNMDQVRTFNPPPNPTKLTDSRAGDYLANFGHECWELDALDPETLARLVREHTEALRDDDLWEEAVEEEETDRARLALVAEHWAAVSEFVDGLE